MKAINVSKSERELNALLEQARQENLIIRTPDGHEFILAEIKDFDRALELTRQNEELMRLLNRRGKQTATISLDDARSRLDVN
jgi:PHD/YefM family antitoxin component YafN of YafNO toxin-antitoxin module